MPAAGMLVHAYLMYGFPTKTVQDTVDALEYVLQVLPEIGLPARSGVERCSI